MKHMSCLPLGGLLLKIDTVYTIVIGTARSLNRDGKQRQYQ